MLTYPYNYYCQLTFVRLRGAFTNTLNLNSDGVRIHHLAPNCPKFPGEDLGPFLYLGDTPYPRCTVSALPSSKSCARLCPHLWSGQSCSSPANSWCWLNGGCRSQWALVADDKHSPHHSDSTLVIAQLSCFRGAELHELLKAVKHFDILIDCSNIPVKRIIISFPVKRVKGYQQKPWVITAYLVFFQNFDWAQGKVFHRHSFQWKNKLNTNLKYKHIFLVYITTKLSTKLKSKYFWEVSSRVHGS